MEIGIVGLPNVGKSTLFNALTGAGAAAENFPFTTIEPNVGIVPLADKRLEVLAEKNKSVKITPSGIRFVDIAGLVQGASQGEGLGNQFLGNIRNVDAICHVVRCFRDDNVVSVTGEVNPLNAIEIIDTELLLADLQQAQKALERAQKNAKSGEKKAKEKLAEIEGIIAGFNAGKSARVQKISPETLSEYQFLTAKPVLYVANVDETTVPKEFIDPLLAHAKKENSRVVTLCAKIEAEIVQLKREEREEYYKSAGITEPGLAVLSQAGRELLQLTCFFTSGETETRAWLVNQGTPAAKAAGKIHTDMERGFIRAEVYKYADLIRLGSYQAIQAQGLVALEGKEYIIQEGDIVYFRFSV